jgi:hypothetical protein
MRAGGAPDVTVEPVPLPNRDEVGQVARAFDAVHGQALRLAADQAALQSNVSSMFVNLSRRSQGLVERQLQLIEQLESNEQDPDQLSNLFQLDHLATRMRRNSENLLVLAGTDFAKRNVAPVLLVEVLRAAVSEIEHYQRITVQAPPQATVVGRATSDVVHLLAELLDNATNFSPPDSQVVMSSTRTADGSILVEIADLGVGMLENELSDANRRLTTPSAVDVSASRRMGLFVVGRLGARHGITVHLGGAPMGGPGGGLTASVTLPAHLVVSSGDGNGGRPLRGDAALTPAAPPNGVPPQRASAGSAPRSAPRTAFAAAANGETPAQPAAMNGLPTRTPGSSLRRNPAPLAADATDSATTGQPFGAFRGNDDAPEAPSPAWPAVPRPAARAGDAEGPDAERRLDAPDAADVPDADSTPTGAVPAVAAAAAGALRADELAPDDADDTPPTGQIRDSQIRDSSTGTPFRRTPLPRGTAAPEGDDDERGRSGPEPSGPKPSSSEPSGSEPSGAGPLWPGPSWAGSPTAAPAATGPESSDTDVPEPETPVHQAGAPQAMAAADDAASVARVGGTTGDGSTAGESTTDGPTTDRPTTDGPTTDRPTTDRPTTDGPTASGSTAGGASAGDLVATGTAAESSATPATDTDSADHGRADDGPADSHSAAPDGSTDDVAPTGRAASPRPRPSPGPGPNGTFHDLSVPSTPYRALDEDGVAQNGTANGTGRYDVGRYDGDPSSDGPSTDDPLTGPSPSTTPLPLVAGADAPAQHDPFGVAATDDPGADALFAPSVPAISEPEDLPRSRRPLAEVRRGPVDIAETTPIFEEIASAWFASHRPVPVDWELGQRPGAETEAEPPEAAPTALDTPHPPLDVGWPPASPPVPAGVPVGGPAAQAFATAADEGWRAASGVAAERPDELTAAGLPKRRPRARLVPGSAGSAVLAAPASPTRSAESIRGRLASYQQGVRQGREIRLRRDPGSSGSQPDPTGENAVASAGGDHDEENR